jgi:murein DD-endopeptidase MepM/ murein hydrolase activator NlpD
MPRWTILAAATAAAAALWAGSAADGAPGAPGPHEIPMPPGWPTVFEIDVGQTFALRRTVGGQTVERAIRLVAVEHRTQPDHWLKGAEVTEILAGAEVTVEVAGRRAAILARPFQMPTRVAGLRLYVESTRRWAEEAEYAGLDNFRCDVRLAAVLEGEPWGPTKTVFPIRQYRWLAASYNNTWGALVPYNRFYYHRGEDFGAIPDRLPVVASLPGRVAGSPLPDGDGRSNSLSIQTPDGVTLRYAHMNIESIERGLTPGEPVAAGRVLGKTGMTWAGRKSQHADPHLHFGLSVADAAATGAGSPPPVLLSPYPLLVEAYLRDYPDAVLPVAGGYHFTVPGRRVVLDGSRSVPRVGRTIEAYRWRLPDGRTIEGPTAEVAFDRPGLYSAELSVTTDDGREDRDFAQVRVYDPARGRDIARGWFYYTPVRGIRPGTEVLFWNRLSRTVGPTRIDFGDGTPPQPIGAEARHAYARPGLYTAALHATGPDEEPVTVQVRVVVEGVEE